MCYASGENPQQGKINIEDLMLALCKTDFRFDIILKKTNLGV